MTEQNHQEDSLLKNAKENPVGAIVVLIVLAASALAFIKFITANFETDWGSASQVSPYGKIVFFIVLGIGYFVLLDWLRSKDGLCKDLSTIMIWIAAFIVIAIGASLLPSCESDQRFYNQGELPYYRK